jgi:diamine N-acetyltransferase
MLPAQHNADGTQPTAVRSTPVQIALRGLPPGEAERLGPAFASVDPWARYPYPAEELVAYLSGIEKSAPRLAIMVGSEVAGVLGLRNSWLRGPYIQFLGILPSFQGRGLGGAVLTQIVAEAQAAGESNLWVCASDFNARGLAFYERLGFTRVASLDGLVRDDRTEVLLRKRI